MPGGIHFFCPHYATALFRWNELHIAAGYSARRFSDEDVMTAAGILEGFLTQQ